MSNSLNITASNFGNAAAKRFLGDVTVSIRLHGDSSKTFYPLGYMDPEKTFSSKRDYVELNTGVPETLVAKDVIKITNSIKGKIKQFQVETFALCMGSEVVSYGALKRVLIGTTLPTALECSIILSGETKDGKDLELYIRRAQITPETVEIALGSVKEYGTLNFEAAILADEDPLDTNWWPVIGMVESATDDATLVADSKDISMATADVSQFVSGMRVYTEVNGYIGVVDSVSANKVTLLAVAGVAETTVTLRGVTAANILRDNIAFFEFQA